MNTTQMLEVLIPMLAILVTVVGLALRVQTNLRRTLEESIDKFRTEVNANRKKDHEELQAFRTEVSTNRDQDLTEARANRDQDLADARANREKDREELQAFRAEVLDRFETTHRKIDANTTAIAVNAAETNGNIALNTTKIDAIAANTAAIAANGATHDRNIRKVGDQVAGFAERVSRVEGYIEATSSRRPQPVTTSR